jgi:hypothetical protein
VRCKTCHYSLANLTGPPNRCPECGRAFSPNDSSTFETIASARQKALVRGLVWLACSFMGSFILILVVAEFMDSGRVKLHEVAFVSLFCTAVVSPLILIQLLIRLSKARS